MGLLLAPYNDSMRLGQGYNSFLQSPCIYDAVTVTPLGPAKEKPGIDTSQTVSYSSHVVNRISDITRSMGISTGSSIKSGSIALSGNASSIDESKFAESDMNIVISVKVVNQTTTLNKKPEFNEPTAGTIQRSDNKGFHETYGDCYISGFIEGGDLHGVISIKVLDSSKKEEVKAQIMGDLNNSDPAGFTFDPSDFSSASGGSSSESETTIAVNWSGGGKIKPDDEEWSLESLYRVASAFPAKVAVCPQRTWAILTPYNNNAEFVKWAIANDITPHDFSAVESYASDLLDTYMGYKNNIRKIQTILADPVGYLLGPATNPISITVKDLVAARKEMKLEMVKIMEIVDYLNEHPEPSTDEISDWVIQSPELWATRLPIPNGLSPQDREGLRRFALLDSDLALADLQQPGGSQLGGLGAPEGSPAAKLYEDDVDAHLTEAERKALGADLNRRILAHYRFDATPIIANPTTHGTAMPWSELRDEIRMNAVFSSQFGWPSSVHMNMINKDGLPTLNFNFVFGKELAMAPAPGGTPVTLNLAPEERIDRVRIGRSTVSNKHMISYVQIHTTAAQDKSVGTQPSSVKDLTEFLPPGGCKGLIFFVATEKHGSSGAVGKLLLAWK